jgi:peptidoglycan/LPS O-acetylase OafA/YrhL
MPGYFLTVIVGLAVAAFIDQLAISHHHYNLPYDLSNAWQYFFFVQRVSLYWNDNYQHLDILNHTWSLAVEEQFYLVCGFLWIALRSSYARWGVTAVCVCLGIAARTSDVNAGLALYHLDSFGYGFAGALLCNLAFGEHQREFREAVRRCAGWTCVAAFSIYIPMYFGIINAGAANAGWSWTPASIASSLGAGALVLWLALASGSAMLMPLRHPLAAYLGRISYALYLCHFIVSEAGYHNGVLAGTTASNALVVVVVSFGTAHLLTVRLEKWQQYINALSVNRT